MSHKTEHSIQNKDEIINFTELCCVTSYVSPNLQSYV